MSNSCIDLEEVLSENLTKLNIISAPKAQERVMLGDEICIVVDILAKDLFDDVVKTALIA